MAMITIIDDSIEQFENLIPISRCEICLFLMQMKLYPSDLQIGVFRTI